jgi:hypothetical protein
MLKEIIQTGKDKCCVIPLICDTSRVVKCVKTGNTEIASMNWKEGRMGVWGIVCFETGSHHAAKTGLKLMSLPGVN